MDVMKRLIARIVSGVKKSNLAKSLLYDTEGMNQLMQVNLSTALMHQKTFLPFKAINTGRDVAIIATGPSLKNYQPLPDVVNIGVNYAFKNSEILFDYLFAIDYEAVRSIIKEMNDYRRGQCIKFYGLLAEYHGTKQFIIPESDALNAGALRFRSDPFIVDHEIKYDISSMPLMGGGSVVFSAMQFALWTNPKRIYIVGCDCSANGHFINHGNRKWTNDCSPNDAAARLVLSWKKIKDFAAVYYPDVEIISVNPVGLKGVFTDLYL